MKTTLTIAALAIGLSGWAQEERSLDTLKINVDGTAIVIATDDITQLGTVDIGRVVSEFSTGMAKVMAEYQEKMADIDARLEAGTIDEETAENEREVATETMEAKVEELSAKMEEWSEQYEESMEEWAEGQEQHWEMWAEKWEEDAERAEEEAERVEREHVIILDEDGVRINDNVEEEIIITDECEDCYTSNRGIVGFHFGVNQMFNPDNQIASGEAEVKLFSSWAYDLELGHQVRLGSTSPVFFQYGLNFSWHSIQTKSSLQKLDDPIDGPTAVFQARTDQNITETDFNIVYMDIPVMFMLDFSGKEMGEGISFGVGGYGGIRLDAHRDSEYTDFHGDRVEEVINDNYFSNQFRYGAMAQVGYGSFKVTARYDLNPLFRSDLNTPDYNIATLTVGFVF